MSGEKANTALMVALGVGSEIARNASGGAADWIMVLPAGDGGALATVDGRGPYRVNDAARLASDSLQAAGGRLAIDENHSTDLAAPKGGPSPARGWATNLEARADGIWAHVEWSVPGAALMGERAYRFISPVFTHDKAGNVTGLLRASLTNTPNLRGMAALHAKESDMDLLVTLRKLLGLADDADEAAVIAKVKAWSEEDDAPAAAMQAALAPIAKAAGLKPEADAVAIASAVSNLMTGKAVATDPVVVALQTELAGVTTSLNSVLAGVAKEKAINFVDGAIAKGHVGVKPMRDEYIAMHSASAAGAAQVEKLIGAMPTIGPSGALQTAPAKKDGAISLNMQDPLAIAAEANRYRDEQVKLGRQMSISDAVMAVKERAQ